MTYKMAVSFKLNQVYFPPLTNSTVSNPVSSAPLFAFMYNYIKVFFQ